MTVVVNVTVDAIEVNANDEHVALLVTDHGHQFAIPAGLLPDGTRQGDVLIMTLERDPGTTEERRQRIEDLQQRLFDPGAGAI